MMVFSAQLGERGGARPLCFQSIYPLDSSFVITQLWDLELGHFLGCWFPRPQVFFTGPFWVLRPRIRLLATVVTPHAPSPSKTLSVRSLFASPEIFVVHAFQNIVHLPPRSMPFISVVTIYRQSWSPKLRRTPLTPSSFQSFKVSLQYTVHLPDDCVVQCRQSCESGNHPWAPRQSTAPPTTAPFLPGTEQQQF